MPGRFAYRDDTGYWRIREGKHILAAPPPPEVDTFVLGTTRPVPGVNCGVPASVETTPYTGPNANGLLTITSPVTYTGIDFGTTQIDVRSSNVHFINCRWTWAKTSDLTTTTTSTTSSPGTRAGVVHMRNGTSFVNRTFTRCTFTNASQWAPSTVGVIGYGYTLDRCSIQRFGDGAQVIVPTSRPDTDVDVDILGCYIGDLSFWWAPKVGVVHPSTQHQHCDCIQWQGGTGLRVEGCDINARYSTVVGTGTPNSGNDTSGIRATTAPYTQADGVAARYSVVEGSGVYSAGQPGAFLGGSISGLMFSTSSAGYVAQTSIIKDWGSGGSNWLNAGDAKLTGTFGTVSGCRVDNNQRLAGWALNINHNCAVALSDNFWTDGSGAIPRK